MVSALSYNFAFSVDRYIQITIYINVVFYKTLSSDIHIKVLIIIIYVYV